MMRPFNVPQIACNCFVNIKHSYSKYRKDLQSLSLVLLLNYLGYIIVTIKDKLCKSVKLI